jgi:para-aminobenzoate synthetase / 4-amino-4-deoxychorismate lyase
MNFPSQQNFILVYDSGCREWLHFSNPKKIYSVYDIGSVISTLNEVEILCKEGKYHAAGFISYEAAAAFDPALVTHEPTDFPLLWFGVYEDPEIYKIPGPGGYTSLDLAWTPTVSDAQYGDAINKIKDYIRNGDTYQVNFSYRLTSAENYDPRELFTQMIHAQGYGYGAFANIEDLIICSASPELLFRLDGDKLESRPMKGTKERGLYTTCDLAHREWLMNSDKDRAENLMILDMVRNDMGRIALTGSIKTRDIFRIEKYPTVWQMTSTVTGKTNARITDIIKALFPAASITGAPKARTMEIIRELESTPRKLYTGSIGYFTHDRRAQFNVAIRTALFNKHNKITEYGVGGGIVWDSLNDAELRESQVKAKVLTHALPEFALLETLLWTPGKGYFLLDAHLNRLASSADYFSRPVDIQDIRKQLNILAGNLSPHPHKIRLLVYPHGKPVLECSKITEPGQDYRIRLARTPVNAGKDVFLYHKTTHRGVYDSALAGDPDFDDVLLWNRNREITESCIANIIVELDGKLFTPPVECGLLAGTYRNHLLQQGKLKERIITIEELDIFSKILLVNSVRGIWQVSMWRNADSGPVDMASIGK